jgi:hypothetical protein
VVALLHGLKPRIFCTPCRLPGGHKEPRQRRCRWQAR